MNTLNLHADQLPIYQTEDGSETTWRVEADDQLIDITRINGKWRAEISKNEPESEPVKVLVKHALMTAVPFIKHGDFYDPHAGEFIGMFIVKE